MAISNMRLPKDSLKFRAEARASTTTSRVRFRPSCGRKLWFARVFIMGQGPRTIHSTVVNIGSRYGWCAGRLVVVYVRTVSWTWRVPVMRIVEVRVCGGEAEEAKD
jgi:hypothetical protein